MLRRAIRRGPLLVAIFPFNIFDNSNKPEAEQPKLVSPGLDRLRNAFYTSENGVTQELQSIFNLTAAGTIMGAIFGGVMNMSNVAEDFKNRNAITPFYNQADARARLQDKVFVAFIKGAKSAGFKLGLFCFIFGGLTTAQTVYKAKHGIENYIIAGGITGGLFRINMGFKGMIAGAIVGILFGTISGSFNYLLLYFTGISLDQIYQSQDRWLSARNEKIREIMSSRKYEDQEKLEVLHKTNEMMKDQLQSKKT